MVMWLLLIAVGIVMILLGVFIQAAKILIWLGIILAVFSVIMWIVRSVASAGSQPSRDVASILFSILEPNLQKVGVGFAPQNQPRHLFSEIQGQTLLFRQTLHSR